MKTARLVLAVLSLSLTLVWHGDVGLAAGGPEKARPVEKIAFGRVDIASSIDPNAKMLAEDYDAGSIAMYKAMAARSSGNLIFSPYAVQSVLGMMYAGAGGSTAKNMAKAMRWRLSPDDLPAAHQQLATAIATQADTGGIKLQSATRLWYDEALSLNSVYAARLTKTYSAAPVQQPLRHNREASRRAINSWASDATQGLIPELVPPGKPGPNALIVQTAALYFEGKWQHKFNPDGSALTPFIRANNTQSLVAMIRSKHADTMWYADTEFYKAVDVPYSNGTLALLVVMPKEPWDAFEKKLGGAYVHDVLKVLRPTELHLVMPALDLMQTPDMTKALRDMGLVQALDPGADFQGIAKQKLHIGDIFEQTRFKLTEEGTEAAAAAAIVGYALSAHLDVKPSTRFVVDHPFFFALHDARSNTPLFTGRVLAP